jgi:hypothetical protein
MMIVSETTSIVLRTTIGAICAYRLWQYHQRGLIRRGEIKTVFHFAMLSTLFFSLPYFVICDFGYRDSFCYVSNEKSFLFRLNAIVYTVYRVGLCLQVGYVFFSSLSSFISFIYFFWLD